MLWKQQDPTSGVAGGTLQGSKVLQSSLNHGDTLRKKKDVNDGRPLSSRGTVLYPFQGSNLKSQVEGGKFLDLELGEVLIDICEMEVVPGEPYFIIITLAHSIVCASSNYQFSF